eukprot:7766726-Alexandrium_andersonii.AAC.1
MLMHDADIQIQAHVHRNCGFLHLFASNSIERSGLARRVRRWMTAWHILSLYGWQLTTQHENPLFNRTPLFL